MISRRTLVSGLGLLALSGCGRKGPLEPPPGASVQKPEPQEAKQGETFAPGPLKGKKKRSVIVPPNDTFVLDPIL